MRRASFIVMQLLRTPHSEGPPLGLMLSCGHLEINNFKQGALHCYFLLGPTDDIAGPACVVTGVNKLREELCL